MIKLLFPHKIWSITLWHLGRDSLSEYSREVFHCKWDIAEKITLRIYSKELTNGKKKKRRLNESGNKRILLRELWRLTRS